MSSTGTAIRTTRQIVNYYGLITEVYPHFAHPDGRLHLTAAIFRAVTGKTPNAFLDNVPLSQLLIQTNEPVMDALAWISAVLPTEPPSDPDTGRDDHLEHIATWLESPDFFLRRRPNTSDVIGVLERAAQAADALTAPPSARTAA